MPDLSSYLEQTAGVYKVSEGFSLAHEGRSLGELEKVIWDTGSEINLISESFAKAANMRYDAAHGPTVGRSGRRDSRALGKVIVPVQSVLNGGTALEAITHSPAAVTFFVMSGVEHLYDVLILTHIAQDFAAYADPLTSALMYRPNLLRGDLRTLASIPLLPTYKRSWTHTEAQTHFVCCTAHVVSETGNLPVRAMSQMTNKDVVSDKRRCVFGDGVPEEYSDCFEHFEVTRKKKKKWNRAATALKMSCKPLSQVDSHVPLHQPSTNKRKGKHEIRPGLNMMHKFTNQDSAQAQISHLGWLYALFLLALMCTIGERLLPRRVTFASLKGDMVSICTDTPMTAEMSAICMHTSLHVYTPTLLHKNLRVDAEITSKGGVPPCLNASFLAGNTTLPPAKLLQETEMQRTSAHEKYYGPSDVWQDTLVLDYIRGGGYLPSVRQFPVGDFVYLRRRVMASTI